MPHAFVNISSVDYYSSQTYVQKHITMLQQSITHSVIQSIKPCVQSVRVHAAPCGPMSLNSRLCPSMRAHASF